MHFWTGLFCMVRLGLGQGLLLLVSVVTVPAAVCCDYYSVGRSFYLPHTARFFIVGGTWLCSV